MKTAAGLLVWRRRRSLEVLLAHPGGPFFARKDTWGIPKGEYAAGEEEPLDAALREFAEEIGQPAPAGELLALGAQRDGGKTNTIWAVEGDLDVTVVVSNTFELAWPPRVGRVQSFPEVDRADWFDLQAAQLKIFKGQRVFLDRLAERLRTGALD